MNRFDKAQQIFNDIINTQEYFDSFSAEEVRKKLFEALNSKNIFLIFLTGDPGVGKTFMLSYVKEKIQKRRNIIFFKDPFFTKEEFFKKLIYKRVGEYETNLNYGELKEKTIQLYQNIENAIFIDEAQILTDEQLELIRILSDTKLFKFVLSMHYKERRKILKSDYFKSRFHADINLKPLQTSEVSRYIQSKLLNNSLGEISSMFEERHFEMIANFTQRNFRMLKRYMSTLFELLSYAHDNNLKEYQKINKKLLTMAAIDLGLIDVK